MKERSYAKEVSMSDPNIYFSEIFEVEHSLLEEKGFLDVSLVCDNPAFVDPFLIFANPKYQELHEFIIGYLQFLRDESSKSAELTRGQFEHLYKFSEVKQAWLGYSINGNAGLGLGRYFADSLFEGLNGIFRNFGQEKITESAHLEKLCLIRKKIGVDKISDFSLNLIKLYLLEETQEFAKKNIHDKYLKEFAVDKARFNPETKLWEGGRYILPAYEWHHKTDYVLLVPIDILTKEDTWISKNDFLKQDQRIFSTISNEELREKINRFFEDNLLRKRSKEKRLVPDTSRKSKDYAFDKTVKEYPELLDYYIRSKEASKDEALREHVINPEAVNFFEDSEKLKNEFRQKKFGDIKSFQDCLSRIRFYKQVIESNAHSLRIQGKNLQEKHLQLLFKMTTYDSLFNYDSEVNNGRGPIDFIISMGSQDKTGLEFKLASSSKLKQNLLNQAEVYKSDSNLKYIIKVIFFFTLEELERVNRVLKELQINPDCESIVMIDCRVKESASNVK